nr:unnamed protein product [Spirometra erinaceieuropaei]
MLAGDADDDYANSLESCIMASKRFQVIGGRNQDFENVLGSLQYSSSGENDLRGLDEALQEFALQKALSDKKRRGPVMGIPDEQLPEDVEFELAEVVASNEQLMLMQDESANPRRKLRNRAKTHHANHADHRRRTDPTTTGGHNCGYDGHPRSSSVPVRGPRPKFYVSAKEFLRRLRLRLKDLPQRVSSYTNLEPLGAHMDRQSSSMPDIYSFIFSESPLFRWPYRPVDEMKEKETPSGNYDEDEDDGEEVAPSPSSSYLDFASRSETSLTHRPRVTNTASEEDKTVAAGGHSAPDPPSGTAVSLETPIRRPSSPALSPAIDIPPRSFPPPLVKDAQTASSPDSLTWPAQPPQPSSAVTPSPRVRHKKRQKSGFLWRLRILVAVLVALVALCWTLAISPFLWGVVVGAFVAFCCLRSYTLLMDYLYCTRDSYGCCNTTLSPSAYCCTLHNSYLASWRPPYGPLIPPSPHFDGVGGPPHLWLPSLRDLPPPTVPHISDEDPKSGPNSGPLADSLGFRVDQNNKPVYKAWMNEIVSYSPESYHINATHSVFVTLEGTQLRIQRPKKNIPRRAMFNTPPPSSTSVHFVHQRIFDMTRVNVTLLPQGLIEKRLWSKKYPIRLEVQAVATSPKRKSEITRQTSDLSELRKLHRAVSSGSVIADEAAATSSVSPANMALLGDAPSDRFLRVTATANAAPSTDATAAGSPPRRSDSNDLSSPSPGDFCLIRHSDVSERVYLFARTCREKEAWYRRLCAAASGTPLNVTTQQAFQRLLSPPASSRNTSGVVPPRLHSTGNQPQQNQPSNDSTKAGGPAEQDDVVFSSPAGIDQADDAAVVESNEGGTNKQQQRQHPHSHEDMHVEYLRYMARFMPASWLLRASQAMQLNLNYVSCDSQMLWLNALFGRVFWDFMRHEYWAGRVQEKIQGKLKKLHLPYFINELTVSSIDLGTELPVIRRAGRPFLDNQGLWIEAEIIYAGGFTVCLETNVRFMLFLPIFLLRSTLHTSSTNPPQLAFSGEVTRVPSAGAQDGSPASSVSAGNQEAQEEQSESYLPFGGLRPKKRLYRLVDRITRSTYFQKAVETKFVQRGMEYVSNTPIHLQLEVGMLFGTLVLNIPPPPSDRLWYGFRGNPNLRFKLKPRVGEKNVTIPRVLEILEKKVMLEFQRVFVLPNMDDIVIPLLIPENPQAPEKKESAENPCDQPTKFY